MEKISRMWRSGIALLLALCMVVGMCPTVAFAAQISDKDDDGTISYVALGASNTNGFGLMGYLSEEFYNNPVNKFKGSVYGYQMEPEKAYPTLVAKELETMTGKTVELEQLAISSMRAEELHVLLDNNYYGDKYTEWRFTAGDNWFNMAHSDGLDGLRAEYQNYVKNADVITVDIGANNFGVYASNRIFNNMFDADFTRFDEGTQKSIASVKAEIQSLLNEHVGNAIPGALGGMLNHIIDAMTYALVGFCVNFDASMERIFELNPDATVVVVNIQNLMHGLEATLPGVEGTVPFGEFYGAIVDMANLYAATMSPYCDKYVYAYAGGDGQVETFLQDIKDYTGDPADLRTAITDCFDVYDNTIYAKTRVLQAFALQLHTNMPGSVTILDGYKHGLEAIANTDKPEFFGDAVYDNAILFGGISVKDFLAAGENNQLGENLQTYYNQYKAALMNVYDTAATIMHIGATSTVMDIAAAAENFGPMGKEIMKMLTGWLAKSMADPEYDIEEDEEFKAILNDSTGMAILTLGVRSDLGNSFFSHPNENGHVEVKDAIITAIEENISGKDVATDELVKILQTVADLVVEYHDEAYAYAYAYAAEAGYIDTAVAAIDGVIADLLALELPAEATAEFKAEVEAEIAEIIETLEAAKVLLTEADVLDQASLNALLATLNEAADAAEQLLDVLAQAGMDVTNLAIIPALNAAYEKLVNEIIPDITEKLCTAIQKGTEWLLEKLGEAYECLVDYLVEKVKEYAPVAADWVYDWLYNNPDKVIAFFAEYGDDMVDFLDDYLDEAAMVLGYILTTYGEDIAEFVMNNADEILTTMAKWYEENGEKAWALIEVYLEELGVLDAIGNVVENIHDALECLSGLLDKLVPVVQGKLEALSEEVINKLLTAVNALVEFIEDQLETATGAVLEALEDLYKKALVLRDSIKNLIGEVTDAALTKVQTALDNVIEAIGDVIGVASDEVADRLSDIVETLKTALSDAYINATTAEYVIGNDSYYVAMGDSTAVSESYVDLLAEALGVDYNNLSEAGMEVEDLYELLATEKAEIEKADLITIGFGNNSFLDDAVDCAIRLELSKRDETIEAPAALDWAAYVGEEGDAKIEEALAEIYNEFVEQGLGVLPLSYEITVMGTVIKVETEIDIAELLTAAVENYAYSVVSYACELPEVVNEIRAVNDDAQIIIVGMYNPIEDVSINLGETNFEIGEYVDYLVTGANVHNLVYAILTENAIFVEAEDVESVSEANNADTTIDAMGFLGMYINLNMEDIESFIKGGELDLDAITAPSGEPNAPSAAGHEYIKNQILNALTVSEEETGLLGDADGNGIVESWDASLILQYDAGLIGAEDLDLSVCDLDGNGIIESWDASLVLQYDAGLIECFPVEE